MNSLLFALGFLTSIPVRTPAPQPGDLGRAGVWFPIVGLFVGAILAGAHYALNQVFSPLLSAALVVALWAALSGGLHLDGLADCGDGLLAAVSRERRLEIMRDPRLGTFGGATLILHVLLKTFAIAALPVPSIIAFLLAPSIARWAILIIAVQPSARPGGMGEAFKQGLKGTVYLGAAVVPIVLIAPGSWRAIIAAALVHLVVWGIIRLTRSRLGGVTGDVFGLTVEVSELIVLLVFAAALY
ncbi:MAG: adenosylcobinamide-GDP ribazoletransferase [Chloroflexi bacterium]|nr:adenosylcobinamide-GDP ribazoletransferase [Chloroflexota bacterium]